MRKNKCIFILVAILIVSLFVSCTTKQDEAIRNDGSLASLKDQGIASQYTRNSDEAFFATLDFELSSGRVDWEIKNPKNETMFSGYAVYENGKTYRQLSFPSNFLKEIMSKKQEVTEGPDFNYLQFDAPVEKGIYKLILKPQNSEGKYIIDWHSKLPRK